MALIDNLISYYKLDENAANTTVTDSDSSNNGTASTNTSNLHTASGKINSAFDFVSANTEYIDIPTVNTTNILTRSCWIKTTAVGDKAMFGIGNTGDNQKLGEIGIDSSGKAYIRFRSSNEGGNDGTRATSTTTVNDNSFHHIVAYIDSTTIKIYVDGVFEAETTLLASYTAAQFNTATIAALERSTFIFLFDGIIDEVGFWSRALTDGSVSVGQTATGEIAELYNSGSGFAYPFSASGTNLQINISDVWKTVPAVQINIADVWKSVVGMQLNIGDSWKTIF